MLQPPILKKIIPKKYSVGGKPKFIGPSDKHAKKPGICGTKSKKTKNML
jgi:hypothetical protein